MRLACKVIPALVLCLGLARAGLAEDAAVGDEVSFRNDVMAVLSKAGCNAGGCHGKKEGRGGLKLSLRGQDPDEDYAVFARDLLGRRTNVVDPDSSLLVLKATGQVPH